MVHVLILRESPSFVEGKGLIHGTHEIIERNIARRLYEFNSARKGYTQPTSSEFKLVWYRIKKEAVPEFIRDLGVINFNPSKLPKGFWRALLFPFLKFKGKYTYLNNEFDWLMLVIIAVLRCVPKLKGADKADGERITFSRTDDTNFWGYNFFLGLIPDKDTGGGEEL